MELEMRFQVVATYRTARYGLRHQKALHWAVVKKNDLLLHLKVLRPVMSRRTHNDWFLPLRTLIRMIDHLSRRSLLCDLTIPRRILVHRFMIHSLAHDKGLKLHRVRALILKNRNLTRDSTLVNLLRRNTTTSFLRLTIKHHDKNSCCKRIKYDEKKKRKTELLITLFS